MFDNLPPAAWNRTAKLVFLLKRGTLGSDLFEMFLDLFPLFNGEVQSVAIVNACKREQKTCET